ncbi:MAG: DUF362 domain-containing protein [Chloroflexi bacterium]|nr:DUF362 domain-containing protein [Chloroflexota bacterium]
MEDHDPSPCSRSQKWTYWIIGLGSLIWLLLRSGRNPRRLVYPCQRAALINSSGFLGYSASLLGTAHLYHRLRRRVTPTSAGLFILALLITVVLTSSQVPPTLTYASPSALPGWTSPTAVSNVFVVPDVPVPECSLEGGTLPGTAPCNTPSYALHDAGVDSLVNEMEKRGDYFYQTGGHATGIVGANDVVVIKINDQWGGQGDGNGRGRLSTNTDVLKGLIWRILQHPDGFTGEIVIAENTQDVNAGWNTTPANAQDQNQSYQDVVNAFKALGHPVSFSNWDNLNNSLISGGSVSASGFPTGEYARGNMNDAYILLEDPAATGTDELSYPKFRTAGGHTVSMRYGVWNGSSYDANRLTFINLPVLKKHGMAGSTIAWKNLIGFVTISDTERRYGGWDAMHDFYWGYTGGAHRYYGLIGREMALVRAPDLNIVDAIWVATDDNTSGNAVRQNALLASTDPFAVDWYASEYVLRPVVSWDAQDSSAARAGTFRDATRTNQKAAALVWADGSYPYIDLVDGYDGATPSEAEKNQMNVYVAANTATDPLLRRDFTLPVPLFAPDSAWNQTAGGATVLSENDQQVLATYRLLHGDTTWLVPSGPADWYPVMWVNHDEYTIPIFRAGSGQQNVLICDYEGNMEWPSPKFGIDQLGGPVPVPAPAGTVRPAIPQGTDSDGHLVLYHPGTFMTYDFWQATTQRSAQCASRGAGYTGTTILEAGAVEFFDVRGSGANVDTYSSARATGPPLLAGLILPEDVESGTIAHALAFAIPGPRNLSSDPSEPLSSDYFYPASTTETDFYSTNPHALAAGQRIRLKQSIVDDAGNSVNEARLAPITRMFLAALRTYGAYLVDNAGGFAFYAEDITTADLHLTDDQVNALIGQAPGTPLPPGKTQWQIVMEALDGELVSIPFAYGPWPNGQDPATAQITTANFEVVEPATQPVGNTPTPTATSHPPTTTPTPTATVVATVPASPTSTATVIHGIYLPVILKGLGAFSPGWWKPAVNTTWQWQLGGASIDSSFDVDMYDIDLFDNDAGTVAALQAQGRKVICYISVGSWEDWRPDVDQFPAAVIGKDYAGWAGEKWLDIRRIDLLAPIMRARLDQCQAKGFDGIEPDNIDGYTNDTGFPLSYQDQRNYNIWLANEAHARGLSIGLKNDGDQVGDLLSHFDWALTEDCFADEWCADVEPFVAAGKAVFAAEYTDTGITLGDFCPQSATMRFSTILKHRDLDAWRQACP